MEPILEVQQVAKSFDGLKVLDEVTLSIGRGTVTALFGENGCGKTTLFHIISGFIKSDYGRVIFSGTDITKKTPAEISRQGLGRVWQTPRVCKNLSLIDNLLLAQKDHPGDKLLNYLTHPRQIYQAEKSARKTASAILDKIGLSGKLQKTAGVLSFGQQKLLSLGMLLMNGAELLLMDEPFAGVNPLMIGHISETINFLKTQGKAVCIIEHNRAKARSIADQTFMLLKGKIISEIR